MNNNDLISEYSPIMLGSALEVWIEADKGITITDGYVSQWNDLSGRGRHLTQATDTKRPLLIDDSINHHKCVRFDGIDDFIAVSGFTIAQPYWILLVHKYTAQAGARYFLCGGDYTHPGWYTGTTAITVDCGTGVVSNITMPNATWHMLDGYFCGVYSQMALNGVYANNFNPNTNACTGLGFAEAIGSSGFASKMDIYACIIMSHAPTDIERINLLKYFSNKTGIAINWLLVDGNMETAGVTSWVAATSALTKTTINPHSGTQCLQIKGTGGYPTAIQYCFSTGKDYRLTGWARGDGTNATTIGLADASGAIYNAWYGTASSTDWESFSLDFTAYRDFLYLMAATINTDGYYDDIKIALL